MDRADFLGQRVSNSVRRHWLADVRTDGQRLSARLCRAGPVPAYAAADAAGRADGGPL